MAPQIISDSSRMLSNHSSRSRATIYQFHITYILVPLASSSLQCSRGPLFILFRCCSSSIFLLNSWYSLIIKWFALASLVKLIPLLISTALNKAYWFSRCSYSHIQPYTLFSIFLSMRCKVFHYFDWWSMFLMHISILFLWLSYIARSSQILIAFKF